MSDRPVSEFSEDDLREYVCEHVRYEISMFARCVGAIAGTSGESWPENVCVEVFTIHLRNLLDFFYPPKRPYPTDVFAKHFFSSSEQWNPPPKTELLRRSHVRAHKEVAHLTTGRKSTRTEKLWDVAAICADLLPVIHLFAHEADIVCEGFEADVKRMLGSKA
jgi:hypothetical protein